MAFGVDEGNVLTRGPVDLDSLLGHLIHEIGLIDGLALAIGNGIGHSKVITLVLSSHGLGKCLLFRHGPSGNGLPLLRNRKALGLREGIAPLFQVRQIRFCPLQFVTRFCIDGIDNDMRMQMLPVFMDSNKHLTALQSRRLFRQVLRVFQYLFRTNVFARWKRIYEVLVLPAIFFSVNLFDQHHVIVGVLWVAVDAGKQMFFRFLCLCYVINDAF